MDWPTQFSRLLLAVLCAIAAGCKSAPRVLPLASAASAPAATAVSQPVEQPAIRLAAAQEPIEDSPARLPAPEAPGRPANSFPPPLVAVSEPMRLSLEAAVEIGLSQNPDLTALRYAEGVSEGAVGVARTYPFNPFVQLQVLPGSSNPTGEDDTVPHYVLLMQQLQLGHQRQHRTAAAEAALNSVRWNFVMAQLAKMAQTQRLFFTALYRQEQAELAAAMERISGESLAVAERQLAAGAITGADVAIARLEDLSARQQAQLAEATFQYGSARSAATSGTAALRAAGAGRPLVRCRLAQPGRSRAGLAEVHRGGPGRDRRPAVARPASGGRPARRLRGSSGLSGRAGQS